MKRHRVKVVNKFVRTFGGEGAYSCSKHEWDVKRKPRVFVREVPHNGFSRVLLRGHNTGRLEKTRTPVISAIFFSLEFSRIMHCVVYTRRITWKGEGSVRNLSHEKKKKKKKHREQQRKRSKLTRGPLRGWEGESEMNIIIIIIIITIDDGHCSSQGRRTK